MRLLEIHWWVFDLRVFLPTGIFKPSPRIGKKLYGIFRRSSLPYNLNSDGVFYFIPYCSVRVWKDLVSFHVPGISFFAYNYYKQRSLIPWIKIL